MACLAPSRAPSGRLRAARRRNKGVAEEILARAVDLAVRAAKPLHKVPAEQLGRVGFRQRLRQFNVVGAQFHLELEADLRQIQFHRLEHVHHPRRVAAVPSPVIVVVAAGHQVGDGVFGAVGVHLRRADHRLKGIGLAGHGNHHGNLDSGLGEDGFQFVPLVKVGEKVAQTGFDLQQGDGRLVDLLEEQGTGEGVCFQDGVIAQRIVLGDEADDLVTGAMMAEVACKALGESGFARAGSVVLDEDEAFHGSDNFNNVAKI